MELTDSSEELRDRHNSKPKLSEARSGLGIDLNEIPSPPLTETLPDSLDVVQNYHDNPPPPPGGPAGLPGEDDARGSGACAACGKPEVRGHVVVCDACERAFHLGCAGMRGRQTLNSDEWVCTDCESSGVKSKRWPLGVKSKRILDMNASPPSDVDGDCDGEGSSNVLDLRKQAPGDNSLGGNPFGAPVTFSNFLYSGNGFGFQKASMMQYMTRRLEEVNMGFPLGMCKSSNNVAVRLPSRNPSEIFLQALRDFVSERHGVLEEGWRVEFRRSMVNCELYAVYCAPDGKIFDSVYEVACYLGLMSNLNSVELESRSEGSQTITGRSHLSRKRKPARYSTANGFTENKGILFSDNHKELSLNGLTMEVYASTIGNNVNGAEVNTSSRSQQYNDWLPMQFEDFFVLSLGEVDARPSYHNVSQIWPVGYRSCWHDKITGSLFMCEVLDGGDSGPTFRVRRCSCHSLPIPNGITVLSRPIPGHFAGHANEKSDDITFRDMDCGDDCSIQMILSDPCPPLENDILSCLSRCSGGACDVQTSNTLQVETCLTNGKSGSALSGELNLRDEIGEILVEDCSSLSAWRMVSKKFITACSEICKQKGTLKFFCNHAENELERPNCDVTTDMRKTNLISLDKFLGQPDSFTIPSVFQTDNELETSIELLEKWLEHDRFGLDAEFVQEIIEQLPGVQACSHYEFLSNRGSYSSSLTVGNGLLVVRLKGGVHHIGDEELDGLFRRFKKARLVENSVMHDPLPPPGKPLCLRIPPELVGDVYQAWELLWRFHEILSLKEPLSLEELEEELINPWSDSANLLEKFEKDTERSQGVHSHIIDGTGGSMLSPSCESGPAVDGENSIAFIEMETGEKKEAAQAKLASFTYSRCSGVALTKAHKSLLRVLIGELQSKVAALIDPNFDSGELKSKRGRKKDADNGIPVKRTKISMLPINELTWPDLARRYILAVLSMDSNLDSAEIMARESGKVFRCLQGDGGVLCGSLTGVAGMEADALLLAEATKQIFGSLNREKDILTIEDEGSDANVTGSSEKNNENDGNIPEWAKVLEPVRKLPTNVGTRIRKCVYDALEKAPPEWAKKILEHSISKEVYKGNASGPTKKAVLSVLADVGGEKVQQKSVKGIKQKTVISISDIIMKQCRIVLRRAAAADDSKVFCNLLGRKLINSSDNDDEGFLGSPAMVSRPLDFRTIDLRLATGAYGASQEAFLEDVRELWNNVRTAYGDQPDLVDLAETLSQNFESLYEREVATVVQKFAGYTKLKSFNAETRKEINEFLASKSEIPKAPWDEGVCKVCGIDRDDDSVLLCDTCDAEYHTYCLNPPLARIPEGNWYCPSCVGKRVIQDASEHIPVVDRRRSKRHQGELTRVYLETLAHISSVMEVKEYWEFNMAERAFLLKFLCDELLNSALIHQHLEQCAESSAELQQKLRAFSVELKNLKAKEENLAARAAKVDKSMINVAGEVSMKEGGANTVTNLGNCLGQQHILTDGPNCGVLSNERPNPEGGQERAGLNGFDKDPSVTSSEINILTMNPIDTQDQSKDAYGAVDDRKGNLFCHRASQETDKSIRPNGLPTSISFSQEIDGSVRETPSHDNLQECEGRDSSLPPSDQQGHFTPNVVSNHQAQHAPVAVNESQAYHLELNSVKNEISELQDSITSIESQLMRLSVRREFLGSDSVGRLYWASATPCGNPRVIVCGSSGGPEDKNFVLPNSASSGRLDPHLNLEGSKACCPFLYEVNDAMAPCSSWACYETDAEIDDLIAWLKDNDPKKRELKDSILQWHKLRFQDSWKIENQGQDEHETVLSVTRNCDISGSSNYLITKAAALIEMKHGPCFELETTEIMKKQGRKARVINDEKMYRCDCLEPIWPSRHHCHSCHRTFSTDVELEGHNDGKCSSGAPVSEKSKETSDVKKSKGNPKVEVVQEECIKEKDALETPKGGGSQFSSRLIKYQNEGLVCPYNFDEICSKFLTKDSNKELVQEIGLIGSNGIPSFVQSASPYFGDSLSLTFIPQNEGGPVDGPKPTERPVSQGNISVTKVGHDGVCDNSARSFAATEVYQVLKNDKPALGYLEKRGKRYSLDGRSSEIGVNRCCVVPMSSLKPLVGKVLQISRRLKINLLDMDAALPEEAMRPSKAHMERRWAWRAFLKSASTIYEMVQATIILEDMIKTEHLRNDWWYWSSLSAAAKTSTLSSLALRIYSLDAAIIYEKIPSSLDQTDNLETSSLPDLNPLPSLDLSEKSKVSRKSNKKRKEPEG
ncbi:hypothetical protein F2P56_000377 [Juglans regia]|uniref:Methyl-CpG-binding domain-containing protein 9 isoform X1 n=2 Tax=Juglans regia TaxID=51240 RepID=A0A2I4EUL7_JUGRE|nr:methyl-CpG-binding domain-containing protein 9 isoform X1 [Juglans regia]KAF5479568.1 hypothetical protein F2P56_000377 [Juglans regia]